MKKPYKISLYQEQNDLSESTQDQNGLTFDPPPYGEHETHPSLILAHTLVEHANQKMESRGDSIERCEDGTVDLQAMARTNHGEPSHLYKKAYQETVKNYHYRVNVPADHDLLRDALEEAFEQRENYIGDPENPERSSILIQARESVLADIQRTVLNQESNQSPRAEASSGFHR